MKTQSHRSSSSSERRLASGQPAAEPRGPSTQAGMASVCLEDTG